MLIYTWGKAYSKHAPEESKRNWDVNNISILDYGFKLRKINGKNKQLQSKIINDHRFIKVVEQIVKEVEENKYECISISCDQGRHRSVAIAEILKQLYYPQAEIIHLHL